MKSLLFCILLIGQFRVCFPQTAFENFVKEFGTLDLLTESFPNRASQDYDSLNGKQTNDVLIRNQQGKPQYVDKEGNLKTIKNYYGLYPEEPDSYLRHVKNEKDEWEERRLFFYPKVVPIGRIDLHDRYVSLAIKVVAYETTFYDLWNFTKDGKALSVVCLFWGMRDAGPRDEKVTFTIVDSIISKEGHIVWHENNDGLETFRTYKLNEDGYFEVIKEEQKGEAEF